MIYIGTSGFSYEDWKGYFYPEGTSKPNMLGYYAAHFNAVEINSTYYTIPSQASFAGMDRKTPDGFQFVVKAHQGMTHMGETDAATFGAFLGAIQPIAQSGKLGCVLAQFPWSFRNTPESVERLKQFRGRVGETPTVIEFRNSEWVTDEAFALLRELGLGFCCVDEPHLKGLMPPVAIATSSVGYVRFHGRNAAKWWKHAQAHERYDYLYSEQELSEWTPRVKQVEAATDHTYVFFNNHYHGKSAQNAQMFAKMLDMKLPSGMPPSDGQMSMGELSV
jgi:uncharacterized protein YecE (DUF72 family)